MKYIKTFENLDNVEYSVGDIVMWDIKKSGGPFERPDKKFRVVKIYSDKDGEHREFDNFYGYNKNDRFISADVEDLETGELNNHWYAYNYIPEWKWESYKLNI